MSKNVLIGALLLVTGIAIGLSIPALSAQQREGGGRRGAPPPLTLEQLPAEVAALKQLIPTNTTTTKTFVVEPPTLVSLGVEWRIDGDDNRNATVVVSYRRKGETVWKDGPPLLRIGHERINENALQYVVLNGFAGSIFDLEP